MSIEGSNRPFDLFRVHSAYRMISPQFDWFPELPSLTATIPQPTLPWPHESIRDSIPLSGGEKWENSANLPQSNIEFRTPNTTMCGIAGIASIDGTRVPSEGDVRRMLQNLHHRGPDGDGVYRDPIDRAVLGHTRLSIIDLEGGAQPMHNEDRTVWVSFNGEIFNYPELRSELISLGHVFYTQSDTEVLVHAYEEFGDEFVDHLNGQFAIALWDERRARLTLVRDRFGILPLFYVVCGNRLAFSSEVKALLPLLTNPPKLSPEAIDEIFTFWSPTGSRTVFEGVSQVPAGHRLILANGHHAVSKYWDWDFPTTRDLQHDLQEAELIRQLYALLADATRIRLRADVPVGAYLSGGLDSSSLVALIRRHSSSPLRTFSIGFEDPGLDESRYQQALIQYMGVDHSSIKCQNHEIAEEFPDAIRHIEAPILRTAPVPMKQLSRLVRESGYKVVLTGEGADEALGGYDIFKEAKIREFWARFKDSRFRPLLLKALYPYLETSGASAQAYLRNYYGIGLAEPAQRGFSHLTRWFTTAQCKTFFSDHFMSSVGKGAVERFLDSLPSSFDQWNLFCKAQYLEAKTLLSNYLLCSQGDRMLMANSVEGRFPFLDHRVVEFANRLPPRFKMKALNEKYLLKRAMTSLVPDSVLSRHKQPYRAPDIPAFFSGKPLPYVDEMLSREKINDYGYFDAKKVGFLVDKARRGGSISYKDNMALVGVLSTQLCHFEFIENFAVYSRKA